MVQIAKVFGIEVKGLFDLLQLMYHAKRIDFQIETLLDYLEYINDLPNLSFRKKLTKALNRKAVNQVPI